MVEPLISSDILMPPAAMRFRVAGTEDADWFHRSGKITADVYASALDSTGRRLDEFRDILDFGCGVGRVLRWLQAMLPGANLAGAEIDEPALTWVRENYPSVTTALITNNGLPPAPVLGGDVRPDRGLQRLYASRHPLSGCVAD